MNLFLLKCLNLLVDLIPNNIGMIAAWKWANNKIEKNKINSSEIWIQNKFGYLSRERYHWPTTIINIVRTKGKAGYFVWKLAGGHGDQDINLPWGSLEEVNFFVFKDLEVSAAKPLLIIFIIKNKY